MTEGGGAFLSPLAGFLYISWVIASVLQLPRPAAGNGHAIHIQTTRIRLRTEAPTMESGLLQTLHRGTNMFITLCEVFSLVGVYTVGATDTDCSTWCCSGGSISRKYYPGRWLGFFPSFSFPFKNLLSYFSSTSSSIYTTTPSPSCTAIAGNEPPMIIFLSTQPAVCDPSHVAAHCEGRVHGTHQERKACHLRFKTATG